MSYQPPFSISNRIINQISAIALTLGRLSSLQGQPSPQLRFTYRIRTIQSTLAIEGNSLSLDQITSIIEGKRVLGNPREIAEVQGAIRAYEALPTWDPTLIQNSTDQVSDQVSDQVKQLLSIMDNQYQSAQELMARLSLSHKPTFRKNYLLPALDAGLVQMQYPDKPRSPLQRYKKS